MKIWGSLVGEIIHKILDFLIANWHLTAYVGVVVILVFPVVLWLCKLAVDIFGIFSTVFVEITFFITMVLLCFIVFLGIKQGYNCLNGTQEIQAVWHYMVASIASLGLIIMLKRMRDKQGITTKTEKSSASADSPDFEF